MAGSFVISLDFELHWGVCDRRSIDDYRRNLLGVREVVPAMLALFERRSIRATWATVGMLFARDRDDLLRHCPSERPRYRDAKLDPYRLLSSIGRDENDDPFHFAPSLVKRISETPGQEIATHTFSHFYCLEAGQTEADFEADLRAHLALAHRDGIELRSIVFPRNQENPAYRNVLRRLGLRAYRSNGDHWAYRGLDRETARRRAFRLLDSWLPLRRAQADLRIEAGDLVDVGASMLLRPVQRARSLSARVRLERVRAAMRDSARSGGIFHLWWHPHNLGADVAENLAMLAQVLDEFESLRKRGLMESETMDDVAKRTVRNVA